LNKDLVEQFDEETRFHERTHFQFFVSGTMDQVVPLHGECNRKPILEKLNGLCF
jgi:hypothetical protein